MSGGYKPAGGPLGGGQKWLAVLTGTPNGWGNPPPPSPSRASLNQRPPSACGGFSLQVRTPGSTNRHTHRTQQSSRTRTGNQDHWPGGPRCFPWHKGPTHTHTLHPLDSPSLLTGGVTPHIPGRQLPPPPSQGASGQQLVVTGAGGRHRHPTLHVHQRRLGACTPQIAPPGAPN